MNSEEVRQEWAVRTGEYSPDYYAYYGSDETSERIRSAIETYLGPDPSILEIGCSSGRHLGALYDAGFTNLTGVELNERAREVMASEFPSLSSVTTVHYDAIESVVTDFDDDQFDVVFSVETLQHLHPDSEWVFDELARITDDLLITVENEGEGGGKGINYVDSDVPLYYRDWKAIFTARGFEEVAAEKGGRDTVRTFRIDDG